MSVLTPTQMVTRNSMQPAQEDERERAFEGEGDDQKVPLGSTHIELNSTSIACASPTTMLSNVFSFTSCGMRERVVRELVPCEVEIISRPSTRKRLCVSLSACTARLWLRCTVRVGVSASRCKLTRSAFS